MKKYLSLIEGVGVGTAGVVIAAVGWAGAGYKWILVTLIVGSVAMFFSNTPAIARATQSNSVHAQDLRLSTAMNTDRRKGPAMLRSDRRAERNFA